MQTDPSPTVQNRLTTAAQATEAEVTNALLAAETMTGANDLRIYAMPVDRMMAALRKYGAIK